MKALMVRNPVFAANPRRRRRSGGGTKVIVVRNVAMPQANPRRRRAVYAANPRRRRRRNIAMPTMANPLILPNRRRRRRNASVSFQAGLKTWAFSTLAGGLAYGVDRVLIQQLGVTATGQNTPGGMMLRNGVRAAAGFGAAMLFPGMVGHVLMGAFAYPIFGSLETWWRSSTTSGTAGAVQGLDADLSDVLDDLFRT